MSTKIRDVAKLTLCSAPDSMCSGGGWNVCLFDAASLFSTIRSRDDIPHTLFGIRTLSMELS